MDVRPETLTDRIVGCRLGALIAGEGRPARDRALRVSLFEDETVDVLRPVVEVALGAHDDPWAAEASVRRLYAGAPVETRDAACLYVRVLCDLLEGNGRAALTTVLPDADWSPSVRTAAACGWLDRRRSAFPAVLSPLAGLEAALWAVERTATFAEALAMAEDFDDAVVTAAAPLAGALHGLSAVPGPLVERFRAGLERADMGDRRHAR